MVADDQWLAAFACDVQTGLGVPNDTIRDLAGSLGVTDGLVLGSATAGTGESGITMAAHVREAQERPDVVGSFTKSGNSFLRASATGLQIAFELKGNGGPAGNPFDPGAAALDKGIDAILRMAGLLGANGPDPTVIYAPAAVQQYGTIKVWVGSSAYTYSDCIVESLSLPFTGGESTVAVASFRVGTIYAQAFGVTPPTFDYGNQLSLSAPINQDAGFVYGSTGQGHIDLSVDITNTVEEFPDCNQLNGVRLAKSAREITMNGSIYFDSDQNSHYWDELVRTTASTEQMQWQNGTVAIPGNNLNAFAVTCQGVQLGQFSHDKTGDVVSVPIESRCTSTSANNEFILTFN